MLPHPFHEKKTLQKPQFKILMISMKIDNRLKRALKMNIEYTKAMKELPVISLKLLINLEMNHIQWTKMDIKVRTNTLLHLIHLKVKETIFLLQSIRLRTLKIQTLEIIAMYILVDIMTLTVNGCSQLYVSLDNSTSVQ
jgi:hypothetical protein